MPDGNCNIHMESDYKEHKITNLLSGEESQVRKDQETTFLHIEQPKNKYLVFGNLTYNQSWKGNNMIIKLLGTIFVKFLDIEGNN